MNGGYENLCDERGDQKCNHWRNQQPDDIIAVWDFEQQGGSSGMSGTLPECTMGSILTKTAVIL